MASRRHSLTRRHILAGAGAWALPGSLSGHAWADDKSPIYIADMHYHLFFSIGRRPAHSQPLGPNMAQGQATLVSWSLVGDQPWLRAASGGFRQSGSPAGGQSSGWLKEEIGRVKSHIAGQNLAVVRGPDDVAKAVAGKPHVVLSVEGATFADEGLGQLQTAYDLGVRHIQLVHFIANKIGDMQTEPAKHGGLTPYGKSVVAECNRLGILIDLAHCTDAAVAQTLELSKAPVVWSHSSVWRWRSMLSLTGAWKARQLSSSMAKAIAAKGGVVGLWALGADVGTTVEAYTDRILELADHLGEDHVAFGTDMNALSQPAIRNFSDLRSVVTLMERSGIPRDRIRKIAIGNYARVLTAAMRV